MGRLSKTPSSLVVAILLIAYNRSAGVLDKFDIDKLTENSGIGVLGAVAGKL